MNLFLQICLFTSVKLFWYRVKLKLIIKKDTFAKKLNRKNQNADDK